MSKLWRLIARNLVAILIAASGAYLLSRYVLNICFLLLEKLFGKCVILVDNLGLEDYFKTHPNPFYCSIFYFIVSAEVIIKIILFIPLYLIVRKYLIKAKI